MPAETLLSRLEGVKRKGPNRWLARCPAHGDKSPSLSIRELDDGTVLLHCFAGCGAAEVLEVVGLDMSALFPERFDHTAPAPKVPRIPAGDILQAVGFEIELAALCVGRVLNGETLSGVDFERFQLAHRRLNAAAMEARRYG